MRIGILTFHSAYNYGAVLQCYALNRVVVELGNECETIDYRPKYFKDLYNIERSFSWKRPPIKTWIKHLKTKSVVHSKNNKFEKFIKKNIPLSENTFHSLEDLNEKMEMYDLLITGSDQVWNDRCAMFDPVYFLDFSAVRHSPKASYAASFGFDYIPSVLKEEYRKRLVEYDYISVREESGIKIINELLQREATICCDPTLLLTKEQWSDVVEDNTPTVPYILVYYVNKTRKLQQYAQKIAEKSGYRVISIPCNMDITVLTGKNDKGLVDKTIVDCSPEKFIELFKNAEIILTNSFHGTVFSIIFEKPFWIDLQIDPKTYNHRAESLLKQLSIKQDDIERFIENPSNIQWDEVRVELAKIREKGIEYLNMIFSYK